jgi:parallel beta-helix repeat protein
LLYIENCTNCLIDKVEINSNTTKGAMYMYSWSTSSIQNNHVHHVQDGTTGPYAAIKCDNCTDIWIANNNVHDTGGVSPDVTGVRGIWCGVDVGRYCTRPTIINNTVANTGHTGIASEGQQIVMSNNTVSSILTQGTGLKIIPRGTASDHVVEGNSVTNTWNAGFQYDGSGTDPLHLYVRNNFFTDISVSSATFGGLYVANSAQKRHVQFTGNTLTRCKLIAAAGHIDDLLIQNNSVITPVGSDGNSSTAEQFVTNMQSFNSGSIVIQGGCSGNCSNIYQDGVQLASLPQDRSVILALNASAFQDMKSE